MRDLASLSGVTEGELTEALSAAARKDPVGAKPFLAAHFKPGQSLVQTKKTGDRSVSFDRQGCYLMFRFGGMGYGPRLRLAKAFFRHGEFMAPTTEAWGLTQI